MNKKEALEMLETCVVCSDDDIHYEESIANMKNKGYIEQSALEKAEDVIDKRNTSTWDAMTYKKHKHIIKSFEQDMDILIEAIEELKEVNNAQKSSL